MEISELFYTIQGEGKRTGKPSFFIRTNYCNLRCKFSSGNLCDTAYTSWFPEDENNLGDVNLTFILDEYKKINCNDVVITGGEPSIYLGELKELCKVIKEYNANSFITVESNGTFIGEFVEFVDLMSISPKLKTSVPNGSEYEKSHEKNRINVDVLKKYNELRRKNVIDIQWKFVYTSLTDIQEILDLQKIIGFDCKDTYLMPEGVTEEELKLKRLNTIEACKKFNLNYTDRIHILAWGNKRGV